MTSTRKARDERANKAARKEIFSRIRRAQKLAHLPADVDVPRTYQRSSDLGADKVRKVLVDRLEDYSAEVHVTDPAHLAECVAGILADRGCGQVTYAPGMDRGVLSAFNGTAQADNADSDPRALDNADAVVTESTVACALTGTVALQSNDTNGRRALTLVPDRHVCIVRGDDIVYTVPEMMRRLDPKRPITLFSGPSATSDIELERVDGVHGPRDLIVVIVK